MNTGRAHRVDAFWGFAQLAMPRFSLDTIWHLYWHNKIARISLTRRPLRESTAFDRKIYRDKWFKRKINLPKRLSFVNGRAGDGFGETKLGPEAGAITVCHTGREVAGGEFGVMVCC